jgi:hypothetical protein
MSLSSALLRERTTQRTDSTHVLAAVRDLTGWNWSPRRSVPRWKK